MTPSTAIIVGLLALVVLLSSELTERHTAHRLEVDALKIELDYHLATRPVEALKHRPAPAGTLRSLTDPHGRTMFYQFKDVTL